MTPGLPVAQVIGGSTANVDHAHVDALVASLHPFIFIHGGAGSILTLHAYLPPYHADAPSGYMEFWVSAPGVADVAFSIDFGDNDGERFVFDNTDVPLDRESLEAAARDGDPINLRATVANFDELWKFACLLAEKVGFAKIQLRYGM